MALPSYPIALKSLIAALRRLPGIGPRSAERIALFLQRHPGTLTEDIAVVLANLQSQVLNCETCGFFITVGTPCPICEDASRDTGLLCVIEQATDILPLERSGIYRGHYFVLGGKLAPLDNVGPENLRLEPLLERVRAEERREVILALSCDVEGEATAYFLSDLLEKNFPALKVTRLAQGLPAGGGLDHVDDLTLMRALQGRKQVR